MVLWPLISAGAIIALELLKNNGSSLSWATIQRTEFFFIKVVCHRNLSQFLSNLCWNFFSGRQSSFEENKHPLPNPHMNSNLCSCLKLRMFPHGSRRFWLFICKLCAQNVRPGLSHCLLCRKLIVWNMAFVENNGREKVTSLFLYPILSCVLKCEVIRFLASFLPFN